MKYLSGLSLALLLVCTACMPVVSASVRSHGPAVHGYGPIPFNMPHAAAMQVLGGRGQWEYTPDKEDQVLAYYDYMGYLEVKVLQYFTDANKASKAEVLVMGAKDTPKTLNECKGLFNTAFGMLQQRYAAPDWPPRMQARRYGENGIAMYTFANSSSITLTYDYVSRERFSRDIGLCTVRLLFEPPWA